MPLKITDKNRVPDILANMQELSRTRLEIGIFAPEGSEIYMIAMVNEYGTSINVTPRMRAYLHYNGLHIKDSTEVIKIPERSYIRAGFEQNRSSIERLVETMLPAVLHGQVSVDTMMGQLGEYIAGKMHEFVQSVTAPPNHPYTVQKKGSSHPLINTGRLNQSITYRVVKG